MAKGMILAAGQGTRVRPLTNDLPKAMVPILGKPVMEFLIEHLARYGVNEIMVNVAFHHDKIEQYFGDGHRWGVQIGYSYEGARDHGDVLPKPMGSAGGMRRIQDFGNFFDETTIVLCGDALIDLDIGAALHEHKSKGAIASVVTLDVPLAEVQNYGVVVAEPDGKILSFQEKPKPEDAPSNLSVIGRYVLMPEVIRHLSLMERGAGNEVQLTDALAKMIGHGPFHGLRYEGRRFDCGDKVGFLEAQIAFALKRPDLADQVRAFLHAYCKEC